MPKTHAKLENLGTGDHKGEEEFSHTVLRMQHAYVDNRILMNKSVVDESNV